MASRNLVLHSIYLIEGFLFACSEQENFLILQNNGIYSYLSCSSDIGSQSVCADYQYSISVTDLIYQYIFNKYHIFISNTISDI